jgi:putative nucleotidyltransferase with HDIG domain
MDTTPLRELKRWLSGYVRSFRRDVRGDQRNYRLKAEHTARVRREILALGRELALPPADLALAEMAALGHDVGRFAQYRRWRTFSDRRSRDHAVLGIEILRAAGALAGLPPGERDLVLTAIRHHNQAALPEDLDARDLRLARLLRDYYRDLRASRNGGRNAVVEHGLPETGTVSPGALGALLEERCVAAADVASIGDWKLMQIGWIYDVNFAPTLRRLRERGHLDELRAALPPDPAIDEACRLAGRHLATRLGEA